MRSIFYIGLLLYLSHLIASVSVETEDRRPSHADALAMDESRSDKERLEKLIIEARTVITQLQQELAHQEALFLKLHGVPPAGGLTRRTAAPSFDGTAAWNGVHVSGILSHRP